MKKTNDNISKITEMLFNYTVQEDSYLCKIVENTVRSITSGSSLTNYFFIEFISKQVELNKKIYDNYIDNKPATSANIVNDGLAQYILLIFLYCTLKYENIAKQLKFLNAALKLRDAHKLSNKDIDFLIEDIMVDIIHGEY